MTQNLQAKTILLSLRFLLLFSLAACSYLPPSATTPVFTPTVTQLTMVKMSGVVLEVINFDTRSVIDFGEIKDKSDGINSMGRVSFNDGCQFWVESKGVAKSASVTDLAVGQKADIWYTEMLESYPWSARASLVVMHSAGALESGTPISTWLTPQFVGVITSLESPADSNVPKQVMAALTPTAQYAGLTEASLYISDGTLYWLKTQTGFESISFKQLAVGQKISILLDDRLIPRGLENPLEHAVAEELIVLP